MKIIMQDADVARAIEKLARVILRRYQKEDFCLIGVVTSGYTLAQKLAEQVKRIEGRKLDVGKLDVSLYRDDLSTRGSYITIQSSDIPFDINGRTVILVDDVIFKGRTVRAALDGILDFGRPARIELAVLIDRGHRELPIQPNYVAERVETSIEETVKVEISLDDDDENRVVIFKQ